MPFVPLSDAAEPCNKLDPMYADTKRAIEITKKFIADRGLVCYGGTALDYAARLAGSKIYDDSKLDLPDLDFFSSDPVKDARDLADILFRDGYQSARTISAYHVGTFRVDCGDNHFIADVSYCPILSELKTMKYESFLIVDPMYQRIDMHSSLSFPYDNVPQEVIFNRWKKDTERFEIINGLYPLKPDVKTPAPTVRSGDDVVLAPGHVYTGQIGYNAYVYQQLLSPIDVTEICSIDPDTTIGDLDLKLVSRFEQYFNLLPEMSFCVDQSGAKKYIIYDTSDKLLSYESKQTENTRHRISCGNYVLKLILGWMLASSSARVTWPWKPDYCGSSDVMKVMYNELLGRTNLTINVYGTDNIDHTTLIKFEKQENMIEGNTKYITAFPLPDNYRPAVGKRDDEPFNYRSNPLLCISGIILA